MDNDPFETDYDDDVDAEETVYMLRCPKHNDCYVCDSEASMGQALETFLQRHLGCGSIESFENGLLIGYFSAPGLPN